MVISLTVVMRVPELPERWLTLDVLPVPPTTKPLVMVSHGELPCTLAAAVVWLLASVVGKLMSTPLSWH